MTSTRACCWRRVRPPAFTAVHMNPAGSRPSLYYLVVPCHSSFTAPPARPTAGADPRIANSRGETALHFAAAFGRKQMALHLVQMGADVRARIADEVCPRPFFLLPPPAG